MRILMLNNEYPPLGGGMATANEELLKAFSTYSNLRVDLITAAHEGKPPGIESLCESIRIIRIRSPRQSIHHATILNLLQFMFSSFREGMRRVKSEGGYDIVLAWAAIPAGITAWMLRKRAGLPYIVRTSGPELPGFESRYGILGTILRPLTRLIFSSASAIVCKSSREVELIRAIDSSNELTIIPNAAPGFVDIVPNAATSPEQQFTILCVGRIIERKGQRQILRAVHSLRNPRIQVRFAGTGDDETHCRNLCTELGMEKNVTFLGYVGRDELHREYRSATAMVLPSENEGMSFAILEAMASGLPIVTTRGRGSEELVYEGTNGLLVNWQDEAGLADAVNYLVMNRDVCLRMGTASADIARRYSWPTIAKRYVELFSALAK